MTVCSTTSSYVFSTRMNLAKSSKISSWNRGSSCQGSKERRVRGYNRLSLPEGLG